MTRETSLEEAKDMAIAAAYMRLCGATWEAQRVALGPERHQTPPLIDT